jgi:hypothetical protein
MPTYLVTYEKINVMQENARPHGPYKFNVSGTDINAASIDAVRELYRVGMSPGYNDVWNGYIEDNKGGRRELMKQGATLIDMETGCPRPLEERLKPKEPPPGQIPLGL